MNDNICADCIHAEVCGWCDSVTQDACDFYECGGDWIKADVLQEIREEIEKSADSYYEGQFRDGLCKALNIIDKKISEG